MTFPHFFLFADGPDLKSGVHGFCLLLPSHLKLNDLGVVGVISEPRMPVCLLYPCPTYNLSPSAWGPVTLLSDEAKQNMGLHRRP